VLALRQSLYLPLDDLLFITKQYINPAVARAGIARLLKREGMSRLTDLIATAEGEKITPKKTFKDYEPGFIHVDIKYLPQMQDEMSRRYLFVAIDRATRWVFMHIYDDMTDASIGWRHHAIPQQMAWSSASTAASTNCCSRPASTAQPTWSKHC
jgi:hypothetical protein